MIVVVAGVAGVVVVVVGVGVAVACCCMLLLSPLPPRAPLGSPSAPASLIISVLH